MRSINYKALQVKALKALSVAGVSMKLVRDQQLVTFRGAFSESNRDDVQGNPLSGMPGNERLVLIPAKLKFEPAVGDLIECKGATYKITNLDVVAPGEVPVLFKATVR